MADRTIELFEYESKVFGRDEFRGPDGTSLILPEARKLGAIELRDTYAGITLMARGVSGYLRLTTQLSLQINPRFPIENLWRMMLWTDERYRRMLPIVRSYARQVDGPPHLLLVRSFCHFLRSILRDGLWRAYLPEEVEGHFKPRIRFGRTVSRFLSKGDQNNVVRAEYILSNRLDANYALKAACQKFLRIIPMNRDWEQERLDLHEALNLLARVPVREPLFGHREMTRGIPSWLRDGYSKALAVYSLYRGNTGAGFQHELPGMDMPSFLFKLDEIFEQFVRNSLRANVDGAEVVDGNQRRIRLFWTGSDLEVSPDIILRIDGRTAAIIEVKYKPKISEADRYQTIAYTVAADAPIGILVSPATSGHDGLDYLGSVSGQRFYHYRLDVSTDLDVSTGRMAREIMLECDGMQNASS